MLTKAIYRGRFAPSPTGHLHFGSLVAAVGSYLQAKNQQGQWLIRIDDIDPPREQKGAATHILKTLEEFGFEWDGDVQYQSTRQAYYQEIVNDLIEQKFAYRCSCSRKSISEDSVQTNKNGEIIYPGFCRNEPMRTSNEYAIRLRTNNSLSHFTDVVQGKQEINLEKNIGDFILQRRDKYFSYQLATGVDDAEQNITEVVRGVDLLTSTFCQRHVQKTLNLTSPRYCHLPIAVNEAGQKLSKQHHANPINTKDSIDLLYKTLKFLGQVPPIYLIEANLEDVWCWAINNWQLDLVPAKSQIEMTWNQG